MSPAIGDAVTVHIAPMFPRRKGARTRMVDHYITRIHAWGAVELENGATFRIDSLRSNGKAAWSVVA